MLQQLREAAPRDIPVASRSARATSSTPHPFDGAAGRQPGRDEVISSRVNRQPAGTECNCECRGYLPSIDAAMVGPLRTRSVAKGDGAKDDRGWIRPAALVCPLVDPNVMYSTPAPQWAPQPKGAPRRARSCPQPAAPVLFSLVNRFARAVLTAHRPLAGLCWRECESCGATGFESAGPCDRCRGAGWILTRALRYGAPRRGCRPVPGLLGRSASRIAAWASYSSATLLSRLANSSFWISFASRRARAACSSQYSGESESYSTAADALEILFREMRASPG